MSKLVECWGPMRWYTWQTARTDLQVRSTWNPPHTHTRLTDNEIYLDLSHSHTLLLGGCFVFTSIPTPRFYNYFRSIEIIRGFRSPP